MSSNNSKILEKNYRKFGLQIYKILINERLWIGNINIAINPVKLDSY